MIVVWIVLLAVGAVAAFFLTCFIVGFVLGLVECFGLRRRSKFRVVRFEENE